MRKKSYVIFSIILIGLPLLWINGCAISPNPRFYTLNAVFPPAPNVRSHTSGRDRTLGLGPFRFPDYLDRPGIVTRTGENSLEVAEYDLWAGSLKEDFIRVLAGNLSQLLDTEHIVIYPFRGMRSPINLQILLTVDHFEGTLGGEVLLEANWVIQDRVGKKEGIGRKSQIIQQTKGSDYRSLVYAQSQALERLSREIAQAVQNF